MMENRVYCFLECIMIERVYESNSLGVVLDHKLCWKPHIKYLYSKMARSIGILGKIKFENY